MKAKTRRSETANHVAPLALRRSPHLYAVILAGGSGTRFWPLSRHLFPKQLLRITGGETLIQQTMRRVLRCMPASRVLISTTPAQAEAIRFQLNEWKENLRENFVVEPEARNTAPAIALAATVLVGRDPEAVMLVLPADHVIKDDRRFQEAVALGADLAADDYLVTFGIRPVRPETGYGYIQPKPRITLRARGGLTGHPVVRFVEKPDAATARRYLKAEAITGIAASSSGALPPSCGRSHAIGRRWP